MLQLRLDKARILLARASKSRGNLIEKRVRVKPKQGKAFFRKYYVQKDKPKPKPKLPKTATEAGLSINDIHPRPVNFYAANDFQGADGKEHSVDFSIENSSVSFKVDGSYNRSGDLSPKDSAIAMSLVRQSLRKAIEELPDGSLLSCVAAGASEKEIKGKERWYQRLGVTRINEPGYSRVLAGVTHNKTLVGLDENFVENNKSDVIRMIDNLTSGLGADGYDENGYNRFGFDREGYDRNGYDEDGYDLDGYDPDDYDPDGYDQDGYDRDGYDREGYDQYGYDREGYDREGQVMRE